MAQKADFNAEEWDVITEAPALAGISVATAARGGTIRESISMGRAYTEARQRGGSQFLEDLVSSAPNLEPGRFKTPEDLQQRGRERLQEALQLLEPKATPEEVEDYKQFVLNVAETVARAHKEGGVLGIGGKEISEREEAVLNELAATLGTSRTRA